MELTKQASSVSFRRHMKHIAHPIIGDSTYGKGPVNRALASYWSVERLLLHCATMSYSSYNGADDDYSG